MLDLIRTVISRLFGGTSRGFTETDRCLMPLRRRGAWLMFDASAKAYRLFAKRTGDKELLRLSREARRLQALRNRLVHNARHLELSREQVELAREQARLLIAQGWAVRVRRVKVSRMRLLTRLLAAEVREPLINALSEEAEVRERAGRSEFAIRLYVRWNLLLAICERARTRLLSLVLPRP